MVKIPPEECRVFKLFLFQPTTQVIIMVSFNQVLCTDPDVVMYYEWQEEKKTLLEYGHNLTELE